MNSHCTCRDTKCPRHPSNHTEGCDRCIRYCLAVGEIPSCFFNKVIDDIDKVESFSMEGFARTVLNNRGQGEKRIGMLVAVEIDSLLSRYGQAHKMYKRFGFDVYEYELNGVQLFVIHSGAGEIAAAAATQLLISEFGVSAVVNFGVVGGLTDEMGLAKTVIVEKVVHYDFDISSLGRQVKGQYEEYDSPCIPLDKELIETACRIEPSLKRVTCASGDKFVEGEEAKRALASEFGADICEMELAAIALTCGRSGVPCVAIKTVSDGVQGGAEDFEAYVRSSGDVCMRIVEKLTASI